MSESTPVITGKTLDYEGLFSVAEICSITDDFFDKRGYGRTVGSQSESVQKQGKFIKLTISYKRFVHDYAYYHVSVRFQFENIVSTDVVTEGVKKRVNKGSALINIDSWVVTDYERQWELQPTLYFLRAVGRKLLSKNVHASWENDVKKDVTDFVTEVQSYFNMQKIPVKF